MCLCTHFNVSVVYVVSLLSQVIFCFSFVFGYGTTVHVQIYANEVETKEK